MIELPKYVYEVRDRHGKIRYRFRRKGHPTPYLPHPSSPDFDEAYRNCLDPNYVPPPRKRPLAKPEERLKRSFAAYKARQVVYFIAQGGGLVKIGTTTNLFQRLKKLQTGSGPQLRVLVCIDGGPDIEAEYHNRFSADHFRGEWFRLSADIKAEIRALKSVTRCPTIQIGKQGWTKSGA